MLSLPESSVPLQLLPVLILSLSALIISLVSILLSVTLTLCSWFEVRSSIETYFLDYSSRLMAF